MKLLTKKVLYIVDAKEHPLGSALMLAVYRQLFNGFHLAQIGGLRTLSKASVICVKENSLSSLMVGSVGCHIQYEMNF